MATEARTKAEWEQRLYSCELKAGDVLDVPLLEAMGIADPEATKLLEVLRKNRARTWGRLLDFESKEEVIAKAEDEDYGRRIWNEVQAYKARAAAGLGGPRLTYEEIVAQTLSKVTFPSNLAAYEFPKFSLPPSDPNHAHVESCDVRSLWGNLEQPEYLVTGLNKKLVNLEELYWISSERRLTITNKDDLDRMKPTDPMVLVSTSGSGKTRWIYERAYHEFGGLYLGFTSRTDYLNKLVKKLPKILPSEASIEEIRRSLQNYILNYFGVQSRVLAHIRQAVKGFEPRHWLGFLLGEVNIVGQPLLSNVLLELEKRNAWLTTNDAESVLDASDFSFLAIDEAQTLDTFLPNTFARQKGGAKRSILGPFTDALLETRPQIVLAGTGLNIASSIELLNSGVAKLSSPYFQKVRIFGIRKALNVDDLRREIVACGFLRGEIDEYVLNYCVGRPRFGMRLATALLMGGRTRELTNSLRSDMAKHIDALAFHEHLLRESMFAAKEWSLKGLGGITGKQAEVIMEYGVANMTSKRVRVLEYEPVDDSPAKISHDCIFHINEPIVVDLLLERWKGQLPQVVSTGSAEQIGALLEEAVAYYASDLVSAIVEKMGPPPEFIKDWKVPGHGGTMRIGVRTKDGFEPAALRELMQQITTKGYGPSIVFPGTALGADVIVLARDATSGEFLITFVQCKASSHESTPSALRSLRLPYHQNRDSESPKVREEYSQALGELETIMFDKNVRVVFCVVKYPGSSLQEELRTEEYSLKTRVTRRKLGIVEVVIDKRNASSTFPAIYPFLYALGSAKASQGARLTDE